MPIGQQIVCICTNCQWQTVIATQGDILLDELPKSCPKCASQALITRQASLIDNIKARIQNWFSQ
jgi:Zn finger protein HypA/HybF involved in hydrogenase expression